MTTQTLKELVMADEEMLAFWPQAPGKVAELLNAPTTLGVRPCMVNARTILATYGMEGAVILDRLEIASGTNPAIRWALKFLQQETGLDVGHPTTQGMITALVGTVLTEDQASKLRALALQKISKAEVAGFGVVTEAELQIAMEAM